MRQALTLAARGRGATSPNPMVGAVVVKDNEVVGKGYHAFVGGPHGEINALRDAGDRARDAVLYVTLEPCNHLGRTPPCTKAILDAGISRVVVGMRDPNPHVAGGGIQTLEEHGIVVECGVLEEECRRLNQPFIKYSTLGIPHVSLKAASTLDGRIAARTGDSKWITNEQSRRFVHQLRRSVDAVLVGVGTAEADDPRLTVRLPGKNRRLPVRIVLDTRLRLSRESILVRSAGEVPTWVACGEGASKAGEESLTQDGVRVLRIPEVGGRVSLAFLLQELGRQGITSVLVEGGAKVLGAFLDEGLADEFFFFYAPKILGDPGGIPMVAGRARKKLAEAVAAYDVRVRRFGQDWMVSGRLRPTLY